jgi:hypothetical protein
VAARHREISIQSAGDQRALATRMLAATRDGDHWGYSAKSMGTWGAGNLDSDYALDELSRRAHDLIVEMLLRWQRSDRRE